MIRGTCYFENLHAARVYFAPYSGNNRKWNDPSNIKEVTLKLKEGSIKIGQPPLKPGEKLFLNREEGRYFIED